MNAALREKAVAAFAKGFGGTPERLFTAPGRVNLMGEHTDYNDGFVLPCAIDRATIVAARSTSKNQITTAFADYDAFDEFAANGPVARSSRHSANYVRGIASILIADGHRLAGAELAVVSDVPQGAGLSSSASLEIAVALAVATLSDLDLDETALARVARRAENEFVGCACGIMDQLIAARGKAGHALLIDCRSLRCSPVPVPRDLAIVIAHSGVIHKNAGGAYDERQRQCEDVARHFGVAALRDLELSNLERGAAGLDPLLFRRARHVVTENERVLATAKALEVGDTQALSRLMAASQASMRDDFEITVPAVDRLVDIMADELGDAGGARMTGGGFGGSVVALAPAASVESLSERVRNHYRAPEGRPPAISTCMTANGATEWPLSLS
jgi:galactokinase